MDLSWLWAVILVGFVITSLLGAFAERKETHSIRSSRPRSAISRFTIPIYLILSGLAFVLFLADAVRGDLYKRVFEIIEAPRKAWNFDFLISTAWANDPSAPGISSNPALTATLITLVFYAILVAFGGALLVLVFWADEPKNKRALDAADNIVKMFGGFLIGVGSAFFGIR